MTTLAGSWTHWAICAVFVGALHAACSASDIAVTPTSADGVVVNISPAAVGQDVQATIAVNASAPPQVGQQTLVSEALTYSYAWSFSPDGSIGSVTPSQNPSAQSSSTATGSFPTPGEKTTAVTVTIGGTATYSYTDAAGIVHTSTMTVTGTSPNPPLEVDVQVYEADSVLLSAPSLVSINRTGIPISACVTCLGTPAAGVEVTFTCSNLTFSSPTATTDTSGTASVTAESGAEPSQAGGYHITASTDDGLGGTVSGSSDMTVLKVDDPFPLNPKILAGGLSYPGLYTVDLMFCVSPPVAGVPVAFTMDGGGGHNQPAALENPSTSTDSQGQASVTVRSSDVTETATVKCTYQESVNSTDVTFMGPISVGPANQ